MKFYGGAIFITALATVASLGCMMDVEDIGNINQHTIVDNSMEMNGVKMNGVKMNGVKMNGVKMNGVKMNGVTLNSTVLDGTLEGSGTPVSGAGFIDTDMEVELADSTLADVHIKDVQTINGIDYYEVEYWDGAQWTNICDVNTLSIPVNGRWDPVTASYIADSTKFTFACQGAALAKCAEWGYERWGSQDECDGSTCEPRSLADFHQACTRMVRADYCGDGVPHTENGTPIDVWDALDIMTETPASGLDMEAEWTVDGAACVMHTRWAESAGGNVDKQYILDNCLDRWVGQENPTPPTDCGTSSSDFFTDNGFSTPTNQRRLLRNASDTNLR